MVFILGVPFADSLLVRKALQKFYGIGVHTSEQIMARLYIHPTAKLSMLGDSALRSLNAELTRMKLDSDTQARNRLRDRLREMKDIGLYRGKRHAMGLPVRGQRTRSQISTARKLNRIERAG